MKKIIVLTASLFICLLAVIGYTTISNDNTKVEYITLDDFKDNNSEKLNSSNEDTLTTIYMSDVESLNLIDKRVKVKEVTPQIILKELQRNDVVSKSTKLINFDTYPSENKSMVGVLNLSKEFYNFNLGSGFESSMLDSVAKTYIENFDLDHFKILVEGQEYQSGHISFEKDDFFDQDYFK